jgi:hypothetical protein
LSTSHESTIATANNTCFTGANIVNVQATCNANTAVQLTFGYNCSYATDINRLYIQRSGSDSNYEKVTNLNGANNGDAFTNDSGKCIATFVIHDQGNHDQSSTAGLLSVNVASATPC